MSKEWDADEIFFEFFKASLTGATVITESCSVEDVVRAAYSAADLATEVFIERLNDDLQGPTPESENGIQSPQVG